MKGYTLNTTMYVFPQTAAEIPYVDETVTAIMVQQEDLAAWKTANSDYAAIMQPYNYNTMTVQKKVWADHLNDDIVAPTPPVTLYTVSLTNDAQTAAPDFVTALAEQNEFEEGDTVTLTQEFVSGETTDLSQYYYTVNSTPADFSYDPEEVTDFTAEFTMPAQNVIMDIQEKAEDTGFFWTLDGTTPVDGIVTVTLGGDDNIFPTLVNSHNQTITGYEDLRLNGVVTVNETTGEITLNNMGTAQPAVLAKTTTPIYWDASASYELEVVGPYTISLADATTEELVYTPGSYQSTAGVTYGTENETITIYPTSDEANISNITAVDENSDPITLTHVTPADPGEGEYWTFTMPASNVTITATQGS